MQPASLERSCRGEIAATLRRTHRDWADWAGFLSYLAFTLIFLFRMRQQGILLAPSLAHELVIAFAFLVRKRAKAKLTSFDARLCAYGATFLLPAFMLAARTWFPETLKTTVQPVLGIAGATIWFVGCLFGLWGVWTLRYSFSIEPQARRLVTSGAYQWARHPIYVSYLLQYFGIFLIYPKVVFAGALFAWIVMAYARMRYEESVLRSTFSEYDRYARRVAMLSPRFWDRTAKRPFAAEPAVVPVEIWAVPSRVKR